MHKLTILTFGTLVLNVILIKNADKFGLHVKVLIKQFRTEDALFHSTLYRFHVISIEYTLIAKST